VTRASFEVKSQACAPLRSISGAAPFVDQDRIQFALTPGVVVKTGLGFGLRTACAVGGQSPRCGRFSLGVYLTVKASGHHSSQLSWSEVTPALAARSPRREHHREFNDKGMVVNRARLHGLRGVLKTSTESESVCARPIPASAA
jgi:hypothetical protein